MDHGDAQDSEEAGEFEVHGEWLGPSVHGFNKRGCDAPFDFEGFCGGAEVRAAGFVEEHESEESGDA